VDLRQLYRWRPTRRQLLWAGGVAALAFLIIVLCGYLFGWKWTGLSKMTLWDWLQLLLVPAALAVGGTVGGAWFAQQRARETALQSYLDKMSELLIDKKLHEKDKEYDPARVTARARTLVVLKQLDGERKQSVMQFLYEVHLINGETRRENTPFLKAQVGLDGADLRKANLRHITLEDAKLDGAILENANLRDSHLSNINLSGAFLSDADLRDAELRGARLEGAHLQRKDELSLRGADLSGADLSGADLNRAMLREANLRRVNLRAATRWTKEQLTEAKSLEGATMPNGQKYEDWLNSQGHGKDGENSGPS
jgi:hypothetical protein